MNASGACNFRTRPALFAPMNTRLKRSIIGCLLGTAVGDALGLPMEGLSKERQQKIFPSIEGYHFLLGKGMVSDDTEHTCMVAQSMISAGGDRHTFACDLAWRLRLWLLGLPAGVGFATLRSLIKLWLGYSYEKSGVFSAGNGPAMRSAIIGVCTGDQKENLKDLVRLSTRLTHSDPKAEYGALAVAIASYRSSRQRSDPAGFIKELKSSLDPGADDFINLVTKTDESVRSGETTGAFASKLGLEKGVGGYVYETVPVVLHAWFRHPDNFMAAVTEAIQCGGDTDTVASILGGIVGAGVGKEGIPQNLIENLWGWPMGRRWIESLGNELFLAVSGNKSASPPGLFFPLLLPRNLFFLTIVLGHGFRRLFPPY